MRDKKEIPIVTEVTIVPAINGYTVKVETSGFNSKKYVCKTLFEVVNLLKVLNWGQSKKVTTLTDSLLSED